MEGYDPVIEFSLACERLRGLLMRKGLDWLSAFCTESKGNESLERVYEVLCYLDMASRISKIAPCSFVVPSRGFRLPLAPGVKKNWTFLRILRKGRVYDLCHGTKIPTLNKSDPKEAPDISLQKMPAGYTGKNAGKVVGIWDAKYYSKRLTKSPMKDLVYWCHVLKVPPLAKGDDLEELCPELSVSAVLTNQGHKKFNVSVRYGLGFSIAFDHKANGQRCVLEPTREEHLLQKAKQTSNNP